MKAYKRHNAKMSFNNAICFLQCGFFYTITDKSVSS